MEILVIDDEADLRLQLTSVLRAEGHNVAEASDGAEGVARLDAHIFDLVVSDVRLPKVDGFTILRKVRREAPWTDVLLMTAYGSVPDAVTALKEKAADYLTKPFDVADLLGLVQRLGQHRQVHDELRLAASDLAAMCDSGPLVGRTPAMLRLQDHIACIARTNAAVLISGESGTGKELVARMIHDRSARAQQPFVAINCAAFQTTLLEEELFGHERGAFTGAVRRREGRFRAAHRGTLLLDEISEMPLEAQSKLLRVLQEGTFQPIGTNVTVDVDVRVLSTTNRDLRAAVSDGRFREDLYYRLKVVEVGMPPLRERLGDLPLLVEHFLRRFACGSQQAHEVSPAAWAALTRHGYPGNVRELGHAIQHAVIMARGREIGVEHLPRDLRASYRATGASDDEGDMPLPAAIEELERKYLERALRRSKGERGKAAQALGISRKSLWQRLRKYRIA